MESQVKLSFLHSYIQNFTFPLLACQYDDRDNTDSILKSIQSLPTQNN